MQDLQHSSACHASNSRAARAQELCENRRCLFSSFCDKIKKMSLQEVCENRLRIITGGGAVFGFLHLRVGNFKNESRFGLFLSHKHVAFCRNFPSGANVYCPLLGLDDGLRNSNGTAFTQSSLVSIQPATSRTCSSSTNKSLPLCKQVGDSRVNMKSNNQTEDTQKTCLSVQTLFQSEHSLEQICQHGPGPQ